MTRHTYKDLARMFGKSVSTIVRWLDLYRIKRQRVTRRSVFVTEAELRRLERKLAAHEEV